MKFQSKQALPTAQAAQPEASPYQRGYAFVSKANQPALRLVAPYRRGGGLVTSYCKEGGSCSTKKGLDKSVSCCCAGNTIVCAFLLGLAAIVFPVPSGMASADTGIKAGDPITKVYTVMGAPSGKMKIGKQLTLMYPRGNVVIEDGRVVSTDLVSPRELRAEKLEQTKRAAAERKAKARAEYELMKQGRAEKKEKVEDETFSELPASERIVYWKDFQKRFPGISVSAQIAEAQDEIDEARREELIEEIAEQRETVSKLAHDKDKGDTWRIRRQARKDLPAAIEKLDELRKELEALKQP